MCNLEAFMESWSFPIEFQLAIALSPTVMSDLLLAAQHNVRIWVKTGATQAIYIHPIKLITMSYDPEHTYDAVVALGHELWHAVHDPEPNLVLNAIGIEDWVATCIQQEMDAHVHQTKIVCELIAQGVDSQVFDSDSLDKLMRYSESGREEILSIDDRDRYTLHYTRRYHLVEREHRNLCVSRARISCKHMRKSA